MHCLDSKKLLSREKIKKITVNMLLTCIIYCDAGPMQVQVTDTIFLSSYVFLRRRRSFTLRKLYICLETFLYCLYISDRAYVSRARCIGLFLLLFVLTPHDSNVAVYRSLHASLLTVVWVVYAIVRLSSGMNMVSLWFRSSMWISSVAGISKILCTSKVAKATRTYVRMRLVTNIWWCVCCRSK